MGQNDDSVRVSDLFSAVWHYRLAVLAFSFLLTVISLGYLLLQPNMYQATALLSPVSDNNRGALSGLAAQYGGLASLAGLDFGSSSGSKTTIGIETLKSRHFLGDFIERHELLVPLIAAIDWDADSGDVLVDKEVYDSKNGVWIREVSSPKKTIPSRQESILQFREIMRVRQDGDTGLVTISVNHVSPVIAKEWVEFLIQDINDAIKNRDVKDATQSIEFLESQIQQTPLAEVRGVFYSLIQEQVKTVMLANVTDEYFLQTVDPPVISEEPIGPRRLILSLIVLVLSLVVSSVAAIVRGSAFSYSNKHSG